MTHKLCLMNGILRYVVTGFGNQCSKDICNKCTTVARQADRQEVVAKRYNAYHSGEFLIKIFPKNFTKIFLKFQMR